MDVFKGMDIKRMPITSIAIVPTCAACDVALASRSLRIRWARSVWFQVDLSGRGARFVVGQQMAADGAVGTGLFQRRRSEERRVGKECRYRWSQDGRSEEGR